MQIFPPIMSLLAILTAICSAVVGYGMVGKRIPVHCARSSVGRRRHAGFWSCRFSLLS